MIVAHKGFLWCKVTVPGRSAHGSRWDIGQSAISKMGPLLTTLDKYDKEVLRKRVEELVGPASMHVSLIEGGSGVSTYADTCSIHVERRTLPSEKIDDVKKELEKTILEVRNFQFLYNFLFRHVQRLNSTSTFPNHPLKSIRRIQLSRQSKMLI